MEHAGKDSVQTVYSQLPSSPDVRFSYINIHRNITTLKSNQYSNNMSGIYKPTGQNHCQTSVINFLTSKQSMAVSEKMVLPINVLERVVCNCSFHIAASNGWLTPHQNLLKAKWTPSKPEELVAWRRTWKTVVTTTLVVVRICLWCLMLKSIVENTTDFAHGKVDPVEAGRLGGLAAASTQTGGNSGGEFAHGKVDPVEAGRLGGLVSSGQVERTESAVNDGTGE
jgi:general stress protein YciG